MTKFKGSSLSTERSGASEVNEVFITRPRISLSSVQHPALIHLLKGVSPNAVARTMASLAELGAKATLGIGGGMTSIASPPTPLGSAILDQQVSPPAVEEGGPVEVVKAVVPLAKFAPSPSKLPVSKMAAALGGYD